MGKNKKQMEEILNGKLKELMSIQIMVGEGGITGGFRFDRKLDNKFKECFGEEYEKIVEEFKKISEKPTKKIGKKIAKLIIEEVLDSKVVEVENKDEITELLVRLGEVLGREIKKENIEVLKTVSVEEIESVDDEDED